MLHNMRAVLFDVDGVLRDSYRAHLAVWRAWCRQRGLDETGVGLSTFGRRPRDVVAELTPGSEIEAECATLDRLLAAQGALAAMPGARRLLQELPADRWAIVTSGGKDEVLAWFVAAGLPCPGTAVFGDDVPAGKPDPACYLLAAHRLGVTPADCLVVEDVPAGVRAGHAAGMTVLGVGSSHPATALDADHFAATLSGASATVSGWVQWT